VPKLAFEFGNNLIDDRRFIQGLTCKKLNLREQSLDQFFKLHTMQRSNTQVYCQIAECNLKGDSDQALSWYMQALSAHPKDSELLKRIGSVYDEQSEKSQAFQYYHDVSVSFVSV
jgi:intraflagellar transport protein 88